MKRTTVYYFAAGHLAQYEDWWHLVQEDDGSSYVEHEWDHVQVGGAGSSRGTTRFTTEAALAGKAPREAVTKMKQILGDANERHS